MNAAKQHGGGGHAMAKVRQHAENSWWEKWGKENPYYGVLNNSQFLNSNLTDASRTEFFSTGEHHVNHVFETVRSRVKPGFSPERVLDYGCGTGRLVLPFCGRARRVVGVDISPSMIEEARKNCQKCGAESASFLLVDEFWSLPPSSFDFVHTFIVLQHVSVRRGEEIIRKLISVLVDGGVGAIQVINSDHRSAFYRLIMQLRARFSLFNGLVNVARGYPFGRPSMLMNRYSINRVFDILMDGQCSKLSVEFSEHAGYRGAMLYFQKTPAPFL
jgi:2-polyprenyl-3-methyl-5-hydroxy-6-metoxy-1,4-benzoquinol methylase